MFKDVELKQRHFVLKSAYLTFAANEVIHASTSSMNTLLH